MHRRHVVGFLAIAVLALAIIGVARARVRGFSVRAEPTWAERAIARVTRRWATPASARSAANPVPFSAEVWAESRAHFADHCATCHANDGSGDTEIGRNLYPRAPDMRLDATQRLTDGELYWIIANGVRLTGMPAWGAGGAGDLDTWKLVHFLRRLKDLTPDQLQDMAALNPKTASERDEEQQDERFLSGQDDGPAPTPTPTHHH